jgi:EcsC family protein
MSDHPSPEEERPEESPGGEQAGPLPSKMTPYDRKAWAEVEQWRAKKLSNRARRRIPSKVRDRFTHAGRKAKDRFDTMPRAAAFEHAFTVAMGGTVEFGSRVAAATIQEKRLLEAFRKAGHEVSELDDIAKLELRAIDKVKPNLAIGYTGTSAVEGAAAGFAISGGEIALTGGAVLGAGAGAAPGAGFILGVMAADAAAVLLAANRAVAHIAAYYGYNVNLPGERMFALGVLSMGTASETGKAAAYIELNKLVQMLARRATWEQLNQNVATAVVQKVFTRLGYRLTQRKLGQAIPFLGTMIGAGMNAHVLLSVIDNAEHVYRERFLREKYQITVEVEIDDDVEAEAMEEGYGVIDVAEILEAEEAEKAAAPTVEPGELGELDSGEDAAKPADGDDG